MVFSILYEYYTIIYMQKYLSVGQSCYDNRQDRGYREVAKTSNIEFLHHIESGESVVNQIN